MNSIATLSMEEFIALSGLHVAVEMTAFASMTKRPKRFRHCIAVTLWRKGHGELSFSTSSTHATFSDVLFLETFRTQLLFVERDDFAGMVKWTGAENHLKAARDTFEDTRRRSVKIRRLLGDWYEVLLNEVAR